MASKDKMPLKTTKRRRAMIATAQTSRKWSSALKKYQKAPRIIPISSNLTCKLSNNRNKVIYSPKTHPLKIPPTLRITNQHLSTSMPPMTKVVPLLASTFNLTLDQPDNLSSSKHQMISSTSQKTSHRAPILWISFKAT